MVIGEGEVFRVFWEVWWVLELAIMVKYEWLRKVGYY